LNIICIQFQFCTALGAAIIPMAFETVSDLTGSVQAAFVAAAYIIFGK
jgi:dolichyl-phosphate-mannose-protein mannosyltransferase